ncbi:MAG: type IV secretory system conjugative DNA transfer family protein [Oscillospiraceae bacterium]|jgi:type IV secretion system protein VirD4|nr:type IV secretory system conjugative DNA transfer family protein [Oscillospiraceae bacterium]
MTTILTAISKIIKTVVFFSIGLVIERKNEPDNSNTKRMRESGIGPVIALLLLTVLWYFGWGIWLVLMCIRFSQPKSNAQQGKTQNDPKGEFARLYSDIKRGVVFGRDKEVNKYVVRKEYDEGHIMIVGAPGSGKTACIAIPTLRAWSERIFAIDIKCELYNETSSYRSKFKVMNPVDKNSYGYDPYWVFEAGKNKVQKARAIALALIPIPQAVKEPFWLKSAQNILTGAILHCRFDLNYSFVETMQYLTTTSPKEIIDNISKSDTKEAISFVMSSTSLSDVTLSGIMGELHTYIVDIATDEDLITFFNQTQIILPTNLEDCFDIYLNLPEDKLEQWNNCITLIINQFLTYFEQRADRNSKPILFLLDEFPRLGKMPSITNGLATLRSKGITICLILQDLGQLNDIYGKDTSRVISGNCAYKAVFSLSDAETQEYFSKLFGTEIVERKTTGTSHQPFSGIPTGNNIGSTEQREQIIQPHTFGNFMDIALYTPYGNRIISKMPYYEACNAPK